VYRQPTGISDRPGQRKLTFLFECGTDDFTFSQLLSKIRDQYGSGVYRLQARDATGKMLFNRSTEVEAPKKPKGESERESTTEILRNFQEMMQAQQERTEGLIARLTQRPPEKAAENPLQSMALMMGMVTQLMGVLTPALTGAAAKPQTDLLGELEKFAKLKEFATSFADLDNGGNESNFFSLASKTVETFGPAFAAILPQITNQSAPVGKPPAALNPPINGVTDVSRKKNDPLQQQVTVLLANAKAGVDPIDMANTVLDMTPESQLDKLYAFISDTHCIEKMAAVNSEVRTYTDFFSRLRNELINQLRDESETGNVDATNSTGVDGSENAG
jgi:hypothetical protein